MLPELLRKRLLTNLESSLKLASSLIESMCFHGSFCALNNWQRWFGNTRVISQDALQSFRDAMAERASDPYQVLLKTNKLPMSLVRDVQGKNGLKQHQAKIAVESAPFGDTFGPKAQRKRVKLGVGSLEDLARETLKMRETYIERHEQLKLLSGTSGAEEQVGEVAPKEATLTIAREPIFSKGKSKRIWNELYKVIDASDVVIHVLDARDPLGTRCRSVEVIMIFSFFLTLSSCLA